MPKDTIATLIASIGALISILSYFISRRSLKIAHKKAINEFEATFYNQIADNRIESFKKIYKLLSDFLKKEKTKNILDESNLSERNYILEFLVKYEELDSEFGILFSSKTGGYSKRLRESIYNVIKNTTEENFQVEYDSNYKNHILEQIQLMESSLKADIGIYLLEFRDFDRSLEISTYNDTRKARKRK